jgi:hypothetical protein
VNELSLVPAVLCGPFLRQVSNRSVTVWILLSIPAKLRLLVHQANNSSAVATPLAESQWVTTIAISKNCFVALLSAKTPLNPFPSGKVLQYEIQTELDGIAMPLFDEAFLKQIVMPNMHLPAFVAPSINGNDTQPVYFSSCRNLNGSGLDAGKGLLKTIQSIYEDKIWNSLPQGLFLIGDQVYNDDVAKDFLPIISKICAWLGPSDDFDSRLEKITDRRKFVSDFFTTDADNHNFSFREFCAQYILAWNPDAWRGEGAVTNEASEAAANWRLLLANVPTYMIFDDHEITDDWNLDKKWIRKSQASRDARRIITNGLAAYWIFQGWGNNPADFGNPAVSNTFAKQLLTNLPTTNLTRSSQDEIYEKIISKFHNWTFVTPTIPGCIFMDTRTQRIPDDQSNRIDEVFETPEFDKKPKNRKRLSDVVSMSRRRMQDMTELVDPAARKFALVLIATTPVFGAAEIEQKLAATNLDGVLSLFKISPEKLDLEGWFTNPKNFESLIKDFVERLRPPRVLFLSGDVHYAFASYGLIRTPSSRSLPFLQVTSSAIKNEPTGIPMIAEWFISDENQKKIRRSMYWHIGQGRYRSAEFSENSSELSDLARAKFGTPFLDITRRFWSLGGRGKTRFKLNNFGKIVFTVGGKISVKIYSTEITGIPKAILDRVWDGNLTSIDYPQSIWSKK